MNFKEYSYNWNSFLMPYRQAARELELKFNTLKDEYLQSGEYSPIHYVFSRVKTVNSMMEKIGKYGLGFDKIEMQLHDIAGVRIITQFEEDIYILLSLIQERTDMNVVKIKDYLTHPKPSGYKSIHVIIEYEVNTIRGKQLLLCEIQIRTLAMDFWASIEHSLRYKYKDAMPTDIQNRLVLCSQRVSELDREMGQIRDEITDAQKLFRNKSLIVKTITANLNQLSKYIGKDKLKKYYKTFTAMRDEDNLVQLKLLQKELERELTELSETNKL